MIRPLFLAILFPCISLPSARAQSADFLRSNPKFIAAFRDVVAPYAASVVRIQCDGQDTCLGTIVGPDGWVLTKANDLKGKIVCKFSDGQSRDARIIGVHEPHDLAMLRVPGQLGHVAKFVDTSTVLAGSWVACAGDSAAPAAVGVVSVATRMVNEAYLGVQLDVADAGLIVKGIFKNSAAWKAGLQSKDVLLKLNAIPLASSDHLQQMISELKIGDSVTLHIRRGDKVHDLKAVLQSREQANDFRSEFQNRLGGELSSRRSGYSAILQHDSVLKPTDCGGPLVDLKGRVIGVNISRAGRVETYAIPGEVVQPLIAELQSGRWAPKMKE